jgi:hypothetical protein
MFKFLASFLEDHTPEDDIQRAFIAGLFCWIISFIAMFWIPQVWIDLIILTLCLYGLYKQNKYAATILFLSYTLGKVWLMVETGRFTGVWSIIFIYLFYRAMVASFRIQSDDDGVTVSEVISNLSQKKCPKCMSKVDDGQVRCLNCGASLLVNKLTV